MGITFGDRLIDSGHYDITPEQERELEAREECKRRGLDPDDDAADGVTVWMVVDQELRSRTSPVTSTRAGEEMIQADSIASEKVCDHPITEKAAPDIVERLRDRVSDANSFGGKLLKEWDAIRAACLKHRGSDLPRRMFEGQIENFTELMTEAADEIERLRAASPAGQVIAHPANSLRSLPESSEPSLLGRETVREETIEECAKIARSVALQMLAGMKLPVDVRASDIQLSFGHKIADCIEADIRALASLSPLKE